MHFLNVLDTITKELATFYVSDSAFFIVGFNMADLNQLGPLLSQLESMLTKEHGAQGGNLLEKIDSLKGLIPGDIEERLSSLDGQFAQNGGLESILGILGLNGSAAQQQQADSSQQDLKLDDIAQKTGCAQCAPGAIPCPLLNPTARTVQTALHSSRKARWRECLDSWNP